METPPPRLKHDPSYRRLKLGGRGTFSSTSYWLGPDHLLVVEVSNYQERYRRFYFRDLQAVIVQKTSVRLIFNAVAGGIAALLLIIFLRLLIGDAADSAMVVAPGVPLVGLLIGLVVNNLRGSTCTVHLRTAVQTQKLAGLSRRKHADRLLTELAPLTAAT